MSPSSKAYIEALQLRQAESPSERGARWALGIYHPGEVVPLDKYTTPLSRSDGSTASYYELPADAAQLQDLISHRNMNAQIGEIFRACYRYGLVDHSSMLRDAKKIKFYAEAEIKRLEAIDS